MTYVPCWTAVKVQSPLPYGTEINGLKIGNFGSNDIIMPVESILNHSYEALVVMKEYVFPNSEDKDILKLWINSIYGPMTEQLINMSNMWR